MIAYSCEQVNGYGVCRSFKGILCTKTWVGLPDIALLRSFTSRCWPVKGTVMQPPAPKCAIRGMHGSLL